jgi:hypothetical protein
VYTWKLAIFCALPQVRDISDFFVRLLGSTVHRGAFEQAFIGFSAACDFMWRSSDRRFHTHLTDLLHRTLDAIREEDGIRAQFAQATKKVDGWFRSQLHLPGYL